MYKNELFYTAVAVYQLPIHIQLYFICKKTRPLTPVARTTDLKYP